VLEWLIGGHNHQHRNFAEQRWQQVKRNFDWHMSCQNADPEAWLRCLIWIADIVNHTAEKSPGWGILLEVLLGQTVDISMLLCFMFWDVVCVACCKDNTCKGVPASKQSTEIRGRFVGFAWGVGHALTFEGLADG